MGLYPDLWLDKPFYSFSSYCKQTWNEKCYKISIDAGFTCPNRDGSISKDGCIFCSKGGSGDFAVSLAPSMEDTIAGSLEQRKKKQCFEKYIGYFQAFTNTYGSLPKLEMVYRKALDCPEIIGISIATRPDCISPEIVALCLKLQDEYKKFIWIELGLQTIHEKTATFIRRGYPLSTFEHAMKLLTKANIPVIVHVILGLPGETIEQMYETVQYLNTQGIWGIKLQLLHILKETDLGDLYLQHGEDSFPTFTMEEYIHTLIHCLEILSPEIVIHRVTGDGPKQLLLAPLWSCNKRLVLNTLLKEMRQKNTYQGRLYHDTRSTHTL